MAVTSGSVTSPVQNGGSFTINWSASTPSGSTITTITWSAVCNNPNYYYVYNASAGWGEGSSVSGWGNTLYYNINGEYIAPGTTFRNGSFTITHTGEYTFSIKVGGGFYSQSSYAETTGTWTLPSNATPPTDLTLSDLVPGIDSFTATVSVSGWGNNPSSTADNRYRELQVWTYSSSGLSEPRRWQHARGLDLSGSITVDNNSSTTSTPLTISANTRYVIGLYATNGNAATGSQRYGDAYTLPPTPTSVSSGTQTYETFNSVNCPITISYPADGGGLTKTLQYRLKVNSGSWGEWVDLTTVSTGSAGVYNGTLILQTDATIEMEVRSKTTAGVSPSAVSTTITTLATHEPPTFSNFDIVSKVFL